MTQDFSALDSYLFFNYFYIFLFFRVDLKTLFGVEVEILLFAVSREKSKCILEAAGWQTLKLSMHLVQAKKHFNFFLNTPLEPVSHIK